MTGTTGALFRSRTGFVGAALGVNTRQGEVLIAARGTASIPDGLTDAHISMVAGPSSDVVHGGFMATFDSLRSQIDGFLRANPSVRAVHCVGHSLGGAVATLIADYLAARGMNTALYTFGSPRTFAAPFHATFTKKVGAQQIYRVYHTNDPVSMIPLFPFAHVPSAGDVIMLPPRGGGPIAFSAHSMSGYVLDVESRGWADLKCAGENWLQRLDTRVTAWLESGDSSMIKQYAGAAAWFLGKALLHVLKLAVDILGVGVQSVATAGCNILDALAVLLKNAAALTAKVGVFLGRILKAVAEMTGLVYNTAQDVTVAALRYMLAYLWTNLASQANRALGQAHRER